MWSDISEEWKAAFEEAWIAFRNGSTPIGAVIADENGNIILRDHNRRNEADTVNRIVSHAEANILRRLNTEVYEPRKLVLYTTMEPCPMCLGTCVMANIRHLKYAARDPHCGFVHIRDFDPYIRKRTEDYTFAGAETETVQLALQSCYELHYISMGAGDRVLNEFRQLNPSAVHTAEKLFEARYLDRAAADGADFGTVYDFILGSEKGA